MRLAVRRDGDDFPKVEGLTITTLADLAEAYSGQAFTPTPTCPICTGASTVAHPAANIHPEKPFRFDFRVCKRCSHGWIDPMPSQGLLSHLYARGSLSVIGAEWAQIRESVPSLPERIVAGRELQLGHKPRRYFELGVGKGLLYGQFVQSGWECFGIEPGPWGRGLTDVYTDFDEISPARMADVIVALDVLEHVADPIGILRKLHGIAAPGGRMYCAMPNRQSLRAKLGRERWRMLRPLGHVNYWSRKSVVHAMSAAGFNVKELRASDLWEPRPIRSLREMAASGVERLGLGDQWILMAEISR
jgi:hypothetical protein